MLLQKIKWMTVGKHELFITDNLGETSKCIFESIDK